MSICSNGGFVGILFRLFCTFVLAGPLALLAAKGVGAGEKQIPSSRADIQKSFAPLVKKVAPSVVNIYARKIVRRRGGSLLFDDPFFRRFFRDAPGFDQPREQLQNSLGSGVIVRSDGLIVTNNHVIAGADQINVVLADRRKFAATIVTTDEKTDLAILIIQPGNSKLPFLELGNSDDLEVGDLVLAIGNPFGVGQTVTSGIVSALNRTQVTKSDLNYFIQTDAAINPGNSGGALVSMDGKLAGVNTAIFSKSGGSLGIGFAVPANMVRAVVSGMIKNGKLVRPWLGALGQGVSQEIALSLDMARPTGVLINKVHKGAAADSAGIRVGDVILSINGHEVNDPKGLEYRMATLTVGQTALLKVFRANTPITIDLELAPPPEVPPRKITALTGRQPLSGATVANMSPALADELGLDGFKKGVIVIELNTGSSAHRLGFLAGDFVRTVNGQKVTTVSRLLSLLKNHAERWRIDIDRDGKLLNLVING